MFFTFGLLEPNNDLQIAYFGCVIALYFLSSFYDHHVHEKSSPNGTLSPIFKMVNENTKKIINSTDMSSQLKGTLNIPIGTILSTDIDVSQGDVNEYSSIEWNAQLELEENNSNPQEPQHKRLSLVQIPPLTAPPGPPVKPVKPAKPPQPQDNKKKQDPKKKPQTTTAKND